MTSAFGTLKNILETLAEEPDLVFPDLDSGFYEQEDRLNSTLSGLNAPELSSTVSRMRSRERPAS